MEITEATTTALRLMQANGLDNWSFKLNKNKRQLGVCRERFRRIELSEYCITNNSDAVVIDTILHEIAHALVGTVHGHNSVWKQMCIKLGCTPKSCERNVNMPEGDWKAQCPHCHKLFTRHRRPKYLRGLYCIKCGPERGSLKFSNSKISYEKRMAKVAQNSISQLMLKLF